MENQKTILIVILTTIIVALATGWLVYFWNSSSFDKQKQALQQQIDSLKNTISDLQSKINSDKDKPADPMANWQTYRNEGLGIAFKYPKTVGITNKEELFIIDSSDFTIDSSNYATYCKDENELYCKDFSVSLCKWTENPICHTIISYNKKTNELPEDVFVREFVRSYYPESKCVFEEKNVEIFKFNNNDHIKEYGPKNKCEDTEYLFGAMMYFLYDTRLPDSAFYVGIGHMTVFDHDDDLKDNVDEYQLWRDSVEFF